LLIKNIKAQSSQTDFDMWVLGIQAHKPAPSVHIATHIQLGNQNLVCFKHAAARKPGVILNYARSCRGDHYDFYHYIDLPGENEQLSSPK
jgi:hypothetical protein